MTVDATAHCFAAGTGILTARGEVAVEALAEGDLVAGLRRGKLSRIQRLGDYAFDLRAHPHPDAINPVRISAHGLGPGRPHCDLILSPNHALYVDGHLIAVHHLLNGATIRQEQPDKITYYHVELDHHDVLLANGMTAESFLDADACAPYLPSGEPLAALRQALLDRAVALGHQVTTDPDLRVMAGSRRIWPKPISGGVRFQLPGAPGRVRIVSRSFVPREMRISDPDGRRLGIGVTSIRLDGNEVALDGDRLGAGWHNTEPGLRWTDGTAWLRTGVARSLVLTLFEGATYWTHPEMEPDSRTPDAASSHESADDTRKDARVSFRGILAALLNALRPIQFRALDNI